MFCLLYFYLIAPITAVLALTVMSKKLKLRPILIFAASNILSTSVLYSSLRHNKIFVHQINNNGRTITSSNDKLDLVFTFPRIVERDLRFNMVQLIVEFPFLLAIYFTTALIIVEAIGFLFVLRKIVS